MVDFLNSVFPIFDYIFDVFDYIYGYLLETRVILDTFSFSDNTLLTDFFGAIHYILGDTIYMYLYSLIICCLGLILFRLFKSVWEAFAPFS